MGTESQEQCHKETQETKRELNSKFDSRAGKNTKECSLKYSSWGAWRYLLCIGPIMMFKCVVMSGAGAAQWVSGICWPIVCGVKPLLLSDASLLKWAWQSRDEAVIRQKSQQIGWQIVCSPFQLSNPSAYFPWGEWEVFMIKYGRSTPTAWGTRSQGSYFVRSWPGHWRLSVKLSVKLRGHQPTTNIQTDL